MGDMGEGEICRETYREAWGLGDKGTGETWGKGDMQGGMGQGRHGSRGDMGAEETWDRGKMQGHVPLINDLGWCFGANLLFLAQHNSSETFKVRSHFGTCLSSAC